MMWTDKNKSIEISVEYDNDNYLYSKESGDTGNSNSKLFERRKL